MKQPKKTRQAPVNIKEDKEVDDLWRVHDLDDVYFQRNIQVGLLSIMSGVAVGALLTQFFPLLEQVQASRWYLILYFVSSILILINGWVMTSWSALILKWPIYFPTILPAYLAQIAMAIMCLLVTDPAGWLLATGSIILFILLEQQAYTASGSWGHLSPEWRKTETRARLVFFLFMVMDFSGAAFLYIRPSRIAEMVLGIIALLAIIAAIVMRHKGIERERKELGIP